MLRYKSYWELKGIKRIGEDAESPQSYELNIGYTLPKAESVLNQPYERWLATINTIGQGDEQLSLIIYCDESAIKKARNDELRASIVKMVLAGFGVRMAESLADYHGFKRINFRHGFEIKPAYISDVWAVFDAIEKGKANVKVTL